MKTKTKQQLSELALIYGVPILTKAKENSRLSGLQRKLQKLVMPELFKIDEYAGQEAKYIDDQMEKFFKKVNWWNTKLHVSELISFCMDIMEGTQFKYDPRILDTLILIAEHLDKKGNFKETAFETRELLEREWKNIIK